MQYTMHTTCIFYTPLYDKHARRKKTYKLSRVLQAGMEPRLPWGALKTRGRGNLVQYQKQLYSIINPLDNINNTRT